MSEFVVADEQAVEALNKEINKEPEKVVPTLAPVSNEVILPGGFINREGVLVKHAEVRELNGADEEALARLQNPAKIANLILERAVVSIGDKKATQEDLDNLLAGDRDMLLLGIRKVTFGTTAEQAGVCQKCNETLLMEVDLDADIPIKSLDNPIEDRSWFMDLKAGRVAVTLPKGSTQKKISDNAEKTNAELNTLLLASCVVSVDGAASMGSPTVLNFGLRDREALLLEIVKRNPGPQLGEVRSVHESCGGEIIIPMSLTGLFRV